MELLDHYLQQVKRHLPWLRQDDIIAELRANLEAQREDKEAELGRKLTDAETEAWLKEMGSPLQVAARYQPHQYLIGPALFPIYWFVLKLALTWCFVIYALVSTVEIAANSRGAEAIVEAALRLSWVLFVNAAIVTLVFAVIELTGGRLPEKCAELAGMGKEWPEAMETPFEASPDDRIDDGKKRRSFAQAVARVIFGCLFLIWLLLVPHYPVVLWGPGVFWWGSLPYKLAPVWWTFYWCAMALNVFELTWHMMNLFTGHWQGPRRGQHFLMRVIALVPLAVLLSAPGHALFLLKNPADAAEHGATLAQMNQGVYRALEIAAAIVMVRLLWMMIRASIDSYRKRLAAAR
jgi:hypothetical protein